MRKILAFLIFAIAALLSQAQTRIISGEIALGDQQYLMGNVKEAQKAYKQASRSSDLNVKLLAAYRNLEVSALKGHPHYKLMAEMEIKKCLKKMGTPDMTQNDFYAKHNILPLHELGLQANNTQVVVVQQSNNGTGQEESQIASNDSPKAEEAAKPKSDIDLNIPIGQKALSSNTFVVIIANENYQEVAKVPYTINDGEIFAEYCKKTLGIPETNISLVKDATANNMKREIRWLTQVLEQYNGEAKAIVYYAGHGIPDESTKDAYLLPVDGYGDDPSTGYSLNELYKTLNEVPSKSTLVFLDACFSGANRDGSMLASARGVAIKAKPTTPVGNMVVFSAAQGDETAYPYKEKEHGLFTYYLLKKLQETKGDVTLGELSEYITDQVGKQSVVINRKSQTPTVSVSSALQEDWKKQGLK